MAEAKKQLKNKKFWSYAGVVALILVAVVISLMFYRQKIETVKEVNVVKNLTADWQTYKDDLHGFSFKYPKDWQIITHPAVDRTISYTIADSHLQNIIDVRVLGQRSVNTTEPGDAIQISIPFDKKNYLIFSTATNNEEKEVFYNIPVTLQIGK